MNITRINPAQSYAATRKLRELAENLPIATEQILAPSIIHTDHNPWWSVYHSLTTALTRRLYRSCTMLSDYADLWDKAIANIEQCETINTHQIRETIRSHCPEGLSHPRQAALHNYPTTGIAAYSHPQSTVLNYPAAPALIRSRSTQATSPQEATLAVTGEADSSLQRIRTKYLDRYRQYTHGALSVADIDFGGAGSFSSGQQAMIIAINIALDIVGITDPSSRSRWLAGLLTIALHESSWNDPTQLVNTWDSNATLTSTTANDGYPLGSSRGPWQTIPETFALYHQAGTSSCIYDPVANAAAAINYLQDHYGISQTASNLTDIVPQANPGIHQGY